ASNRPTVARRSRYQRGGTRARHARARAIASASTAAGSVSTTAQATAQASSAASRQRASSEASGEATTGGGVKRICTRASGSGHGFLLDQRLRLDDGVLGREGVEGRQEQAAGAEVRQHEPQRRQR